MPEEKLDDYEEIEFIGWLLEKQVTADVDTADDGWRQENRKYRFSNRE